MKVIRWITVTYSVFLIGVVLMADIGRGGRLWRMMESMPGGDKSGHFFLMGLLSFLLNLNLAAKRRPLGPFNVLTGSVIVAVVVFIEEFTQMFLSARGFSLLDLAADMVGIVLFGELAAWLLARYSGRSGGIGGGTA